MALKDFVALADEKLHEVFTRKAYDPSRDRAALIKRLDTAHAQFNATEPTRGRKMWRLANGVVELTLPFAIGGQRVFHIPSERFADAIAHLKTGIGKGEADAELRAQPEGTPRAARKPREPGAARASGGTRGWSAERHAKYAATIAARKQAKG